MKILHTVQSYYPSVGGMQEVVRQLSEYLVSRGHDVTVATSFHPGRKTNVHHGVNIVSFDINGNEVKGMTGEVEKYKAFLLQSSYDIIVNFAAQQWATDIALPILKKINAVKIFVPTGFSGLYMPEYATYFLKMKEWMHDYDMHIFLSQDYRDIHFAKDAGITKWCVIPNGASSQEFDDLSKGSFRKKWGISDDAFLILHIGSFTGMKGHKEAIEIFCEAKIPQAVLLMIGNNIEVLKKNRWRILPIKTLSRYLLSMRKKIMLRDLSRENTVLALKNSQLLLFPSNIECSPVVLFESIAASVPFLTTNVGNAAEIITWTQGGKIMPTVKDERGFSRANITASAQLLRDVYHDNDMRKKMASSGRKAWENHFRWEQIGDQYEKVYLQLLTSKDSIKND